jgi:TfoX/Sxy family transcriptional regulator of competence genes
MASSPSFIEYIIEMIALAKVPNIRSKKMFGQIGLYSDEMFFALIFDDKFYLKGNQDSQHLYPDLETRAYKGSKGFYYYPTEWLEDSEKLKHYCTNAIEVAILSKSKKKKL